MKVRKAELPEGGAPTLFAPVVSALLRWPQLGVAGLSLVGTAMIFAPLLRGDVLVGRDMVRVYLPVKSFWAETIRAGRFPEWFPFDGLGQPFVPMVISGPFHPSNLFYLWFEAASATTYLALLCFPLAMLGTRWLARELGLSQGASLVAAVWYAFSGYLIGVTDNLLYLMAAATVPWALAAAARLSAEPSPRWAGLGIALLSSILFTGDALSFLVCCALAALLIALRSPGESRRFRLAALVLLGTAACTSIQWLPATLVTSSSVIGTQPASAAVLWSLHPLQLLELAAGPILALPHRTMADREAALGLFRFGMPEAWVSTVGVTAPAGLLAGWWVVSSWRRRSTRLALALFVVTLLFALGKHAGLWSLLATWFASLRALRYPVKLGGFLSLGIALAGGAGFQQIRSASRGRSGQGALGVGLAFLLVACALEWAFGFWSRLILRLASGSTSALWPALHHSLLVGLATSSLACAVTLWAVTVRKDRSVLMVALVTLVQWVIVAPPLIEHSPGELLTSEPVYANALQARAPLEPPLRVSNTILESFRPEGRNLTGTDTESAGMLATLTPVTGALYGIEDADFYLPVVSRWFATLRISPDWLSRYAPLFAVRFVSANGSDYRKAKGNPAFVISSIPALDSVLVENASAATHAYLARPTCAPTETDLIERLRKSRPRDAPAIEVCDSQNAPGPGGAVEGTIRRVRRENERHEYEIQASEPAVLVVNDAWFPGWTARVDGQPAEVHRVNLVVRGVHLGPGPHHVSFTYRTPGLRAAAVPSSLAWLAVALALVWPSRRRSAEPQSH